MSFYSYGSMFNLYTIWDSSMYTVGYIYYDVLQFLAMA